jgi:beta-phosphoglucomutase
MDGVLVDSGAAHFASWAQLGDEIGTPFTRALFDRTFGMHNNQIIPLWLGATVSEDEVRRHGLRKEELYRAVARDVLRPLPGAVELVTALDDNGFALAVASSGPRANVALILDILGLATRFDFLSTGDEVTHGKPHPEVFLKAIQGLGRQPTECVVIEDAPQGVQAARAAGTAVVAVTSSRPRADLADADLVVDSLTELDPNRLTRIIEGVARK